MFLSIMGSQGTNGSPKTNGVSIRFQFLQTETKVIVSIESSFVSVVIPAASLVLSPLLQSHRLSKVISSADPSFVYHGTVIVKL
mmetsp:Transcript_24145/g.51260  ORF Transcript_24145/g.51260 Transcript_24145/m.51260 type:complete len:84 (-) Transcript_24145:418-669(-)